MVKQFSLRQMFTLVVAVAIVASVLSMIGNGNFAGAYWLVMIALSVRLAMCCRQDRPWAIGSALCGMLLVTFACVVVAGARGQGTLPGTVTAEVIDADTQQPIVNARVRIVEDYTLSLDDAIRRTYEEGFDDGPIWLAPVVLNGVSDAETGIDFAIPTEASSEELQDTLQTARTDHSGSATLNISLDMSFSSNVLWARYSTHFSYYSIIAVDAPGYQSAFSYLRSLSDEYRSGWGSKSEVTQDIPVQIELFREKPEADSKPNP